jgi:hypothetical protein
MDACCRSYRRIETRAAIKRQLHNQVLFPDRWERMSAMPSRLSADWQQHELAFFHLLYLAFCNRQLWRIDQIISGVDVRYVGLDLVQPRRRIIVSR